VIETIALLALLLALWAIVLRDAWRAWQPARLLLAGRYAEARVAAERLERSWMRALRGVRLSARYAIGCALHLEGDLEGSRAALQPLHAQRLRGNMRYAICSIDAANLVLLDRDHARASELLDEAAQVHRPPEDILLAAHAKHGLGETAVAEGLFIAAGEARNDGGAFSANKGPFSGNKGPFSGNKGPFSGNKGPFSGNKGASLGSVLLVEDRRQQEAIFHALRGLYLVKVGRGAAAQRDFEIAANSPITNVYVERARAMLQARSVDPAGDPRSSLAPQVVGNETANDDA
jgi:hypothetical protein